MNKIYESPSMVVHDDREPLTIEQALEILWDNKPINICQPPDYTADDESNIFDTDFPIFITEIISPELLEKQPKEESEKQIRDYLRGYEIYR